MKDTTNSKKPIKLSSDDGKAHVWACGACGIVNHTEDDALGHCAPNICECGATITQHYYLKCKDCEAKATAEREQAEYDKAPKVSYSDYGGVYLYWNENYYDSVESLFDDCDDLENLPTWAWGTEEEQMKLDAEGILEQALEDHAEDARDQLLADAEKDLQTLLDTWCENNKVVSYFPNGTVVLFEQEAAEYRVEQEAMNKS